MSDLTAKIIEVSVLHGYISQAQAALLHEELFMFPGGNIIAIMMRRGMISPDQARKIEAAANGEKNQVDYLEDIDVEPGQPETPKLQQAPPSRIEPLSSNTNRPLFSKSGESITPAPSNEPVSSGRSFDSPLGGRLSIAEALQQSIAAANLTPPAIKVESKPVTDDRGIFPDSRMTRILKAGRERGCSDLHLTVGKPPYFRKEGKIFFLDDPPLTASLAEELNRSVLTAEQQAILDRELQVDFSFDHGVNGRFRANVYRQRQGLEGAYRFIPSTVPTLDSLGLPKVLERLTTYPQGMNLVTGPGGCGKTSTIAAMLEHINRHRYEHIITVEDPVEYVLESNCCQITQREVGTHTESFAHALRTALRQDPDVIMIGELRDLETTSISITAAETGHLVFGTLHTSSVIRTVARILDVYPPNQRAQICMMVAESLRGIMSQQLIDRKDGNGRVCAMEVLLVTTGVSQVIKEGKTHQLVSHMQSGRKLGMISMDDALMELFKAGKISGWEAYSRADNKAPFELIRGQA